MLLFIVISCLWCCKLHKISIHLMLLFINNEFGMNQPGIGFQYIPCYCLSNSTPGMHFPTLPFQYIPCYCLSLKIDKQYQAYNHFNTSHVTVYLPIFAIISAFFSNFNTSHVTVYHSAPGNGFNEKLFQYIPCYCLSSSAG